ncbi:MAG: ATP-binding protein, partial [Bacteroidales bacterium]|nr:ATP-binding protein [Bacteroidales bacterium]
MENEATPTQPHTAVVYDESKIRHLEDTEHIRTRPGMYIGRLGDGSHAEDGIYVLLKESIDNSIDEFNEGYGKRIEVDITDDLRAEVRDYGRGIPLGKLVEAVSKLNTGGKYDTAVFTASVGMNGVGLKAVNALSSRFTARSVRDGRYRQAVFEQGCLTSDTEGDTHEENGTYIFFEPDAKLFSNYRFRSEFVENMLRNYTYLNTGLAIYYNGRRILSRNGLEDLLNDNMTVSGLPHSHPNQHTEAELKLIRDMRRRNPELGMIELWHRLRQRGYTRRPESLFRIMRKMGMFPPEKLKKTYKPKPYEQMTYPGQRVQVDVKVVPRACIADPELRLFQYTAIDEFTRLRFLAAYPEQSTYSSADFLRKLTAWYARRGIKVECVQTDTGREHRIRGNGFGDAGTEKCTAQADILTVRSVNIAIGGIEGVPNTLSPMELIIGITPEHEALQLAAYGVGDGDHITGSRDRGLLHCRFVNDVLHNGERKKDGIGRLPVERAHGEIVVLSLPNS